MRSAKHCFHLHLPEIEKAVMMMMMMMGPHTQHKVRQRYGYRLLRFVVVMVRSVVGSLNGFGYLEVVR